jgi:uncharacterized protein YmfQ (DUF2313 family)
MTTTNINLFNPGTDKEHAFMLAKHMPTGRTWEAAFDGDKNLGKLIKALALEYYRLSVLTKKIETEMDINQTEDLITEWEASVGIPNDCFSTNTSLENRRIQVRETFSNFGGVQTAEDFVRVANVFGINISVKPASSDSLFPLVFPILFLGDVKAVKHTIVVTFLDLLTSDNVFPLTFPFTFQPDNESFLRCLFEVLAPANVQIIFNFS